MMKKYIPLIFAILLVHNPTFSKKSSQIKTAKKSIKRSNSCNSCNSCKPCNPCNPCVTSCNPCNTSSNPCNNACCCDVCENIKKAQRRVNALATRVTAARQRTCQALCCQQTNGDEARYADRRGSFGKSLEQLDSGFIDPAAFNQMVCALDTNNQAAFNAIAMGTEDPVQRRLVSPQAAFAFNLDGADGWINCMPPAPALASAETAGEMVELYWAALLRDVPFNEYATNFIAQDAIAELNSLSNFKGPKMNGQVTAQTLFRAGLPGDLIGPYISQFLYLPAPYGPPENFDGGYALGTPGIDFQAQVVPLDDAIGGIPINDFMYEFNEWHFIQEGNFPTNSISYSDDRIFIRNGRDLGSYVHYDTPQQPHINAANILCNFGTDALDQNNPYINNPTQEAFATYGKPDIIYLVSVAAEMALRAAWYQKWLVHRRARPEFVGFLINQQRTGQLENFMNPDILNSEALDQTFAIYNSYFFPQAYPEGSPTHPAYPAGHSTVAGACVTILKAFFNEDFVIPEPVMPNPTNDMLIPYAGEPLTVGNELNKLAGNISFGRCIAGVHYRSDGLGMMLGEQIAISILQDEAFTRNIPFAGFSLTKFDGTKITIGAKQTAPNLN